MCISVTASADSLPLLASYLAKHPEFKPPPGGYVAPVAVTAAPHYGAGQAKKRRYALPAAYALPVASYGTGILRAQAAGLAAPARAQATAESVAAAAVMRDGEDIADAVAAALNTGGFAVASPPQSVNAAAVERGEAAAAAPGWPMTLSSGFPADSASTCLPAAFGSVAAAAVPVTPQPPSALCAPLATDSTGARTTKRTRGSRDTANVSGDEPGPRDPDGSGGDDDDEAPEPTASRCSSDDSSSFDDAEADPRPRLLASPTHAPHSPQQLRLVATVDAAPLGDPAPDHGTTATCDMLLPAVMSQLQGLGLDAGTGLVHHELGSQLAAFPNVAVAPASGTPLLAHAPAASTDVTLHGAPAVGPANPFVVATCDALLPKVVVQMHRLGLCDDTGPDRPQLGLLLAALPDLATTPGLPLPLPPAAAVSLRIAIALAPDILAAPQTLPDPIVAAALTAAAAPTAAAAAPSFDPQPAPQPLAHLVPSPLPVAAMAALLAPAALAAPPHAPPGPRRRARGRQWRHALSSLTRTASLHLVVTKYATASSAVGLTDAHTAALIAAEAHIQSALNALLAVPGWDGATAAAMHDIAAAGTIPDEQATVELLRSITAVVAPDEAGRPPADLASWAGDAVGPLARASVQEAVKCATADAARVPTQRR